MSAQEEPSSASSASRTAALRSHAGFASRVPGCTATTIRPATASAASRSQPSFAGTRYATVPAPTPLALLVAAGQPRGLQELLVSVQAPRLQANEQEPE